MKQLVAPIALVLLFYTAGCNERAASPPEDPAGEAEVITTWPASRETDQGHFSVVLEPSEGAIERNRHFSLDITVKTTTDGDSAPPVPGETLEVKVDADMPSHRHGMNTKPEILKTGDHRYRADGMLFHMGGDWVITVEITGTAGPEKAAFPVFIE